VKSLAGAGTVSSLITNTNNFTLTIHGGTDTSSTVFAGVISDGSTSAVHIIKNGATTQVFSGVNTYRGATTVNAGTLLINGTHIQSVAGSGYTVNNDGTLGGTGLIARSTTSNNQSMVTVASGGTLAPGGNGVIGSLKLDGQYMTAAIGNRHLTMQSDAVFRFDLAGNGSSADTLDFWNYVSGDLTLSTNALNLSLLGPQVSGTYTVDLFRFYSDNGIALTASGVTNGLAVGTLGAGITDATLDYTTVPGVIRLNYTVVAIPEPSSAFLAAAGVIGLLLHRRRSRFAR